MNAQSDETQSVFPHEQAPDIPSHVSSLTRRDLDGFLESCGVSPLTDWQWRVVVALGVLRDQEQTAAEVKDRPNVIVHPRAPGERFHRVVVLKCSRGGGVCPKEAECDCRREAMLNVDLP